eukprot:5159005-Pyramimonas_sp.AAC.1
MHEAAQSTRRGGIDLPSACWTPPREYTPGPNPSQDSPNRCGYVPASFSHPTCDPTAAERPTAPPMDYPVYPDHHAQVTGNPRGNAAGESACTGDSRRLQS